MSLMLLILYNNLSMYYLLLYLIDKTHILLKILSLLVFSSFLIMNVIVKMFKIY